MKLYSLPRTGATYRSHGVPSWKEMAYEFAEDPRKFLEVYHDRSLAETSNSVDRTKFPRKIRRRIPHRRDGASLLRRYLHGIRRCGYFVLSRNDFASTLWPPSTGLKGPP